MLLKNIEYASTKLNLRERARHLKQIEVYDSITTRLTEVFSFMNQQYAHTDM